MRASGASRGQGDARDACAASRALFAVACLLVAAPSCTSAVSQPFLQDSATDTADVTPEWDGDTAGGDPDASGDDPYPDTAVDPVDPDPATDCVPAGPEACNGVDDDCDGLADEDFPCAAGTAVACTTECGTTGTGICGGACDPPDAASCLPPTEACNGYDDDCDGEADEDFDCVAGQIVDCTNSCGATGQGTCHLDCTLPEPADCGVGAETCNGVDDNCNGTIDEGYLCAAGAAVSCTTSCGSAGTGTCSPTCGLPPVSGCAAPAETCNGVDDDCSGARDDGPGMQCAMGATVACATTCGSSGSGACSSTCTLPPATSCTPPAETCNGVDDDCNGLADDGSGMQCVRGASGIPCTTGGGATGTQSCSTTCTLGACCAASDTCGNLWDDDCDGTVDDGCCTALDTCGCAAVASVPGSYSGSTSSLADDMYGGCGSTGGRDAVYLISLSATTYLHLDTLGSSFDTVLSVFPSTCGGSALGCNDDYSGTTSQLELTLAAGIYYVVVDGYSSSSYGSYTLNISGGGGTSGDNCGSPFVRTWPGTATGTTAGFTNDWSSWSCQSSASGPDVVYQLVMGSSASVTASLAGSSYDTILAIMDSTCATTLACNDDYSGLQSQVTATIGPGTYHVIVDGYAGSSGTYTLSVSY